METTYGFTGEQLDTATSLQYLRARYYSPSLKIFLSRDPFPGWVGLPASQHGYSYVHNNPISYTDPSGEFILDAAFLLYDIGAIGWDAYKISATTGQEREDYKRQLGIDTAALGIDLLMLLIPGSGGGAAYRFAVSGAGASVDIARTAARLSIPKELLRIIQTAIKLGQINAQILCSSSVSDGGSNFPGGNSHSSGNGSSSSSPNPLDPQRNTQLDKEKVVHRENGEPITDIDSIEQTPEGEIWLIEEKSATWALNVQKWSRKQITQKLESYIEAIESGVDLGVSSQNIGVRMTGGSLTPGLQKAIESAIENLRVSYPNYNFALFIVE